MQAHSKPICLLFLFTAVLFSTVTSVSAQTSSAQITAGKNSFENFNELQNQARQLEEESRFAEVIEIYKQALLLKPDDAEVYNHLGAAYVKVRRFEEALPVLLRAVAIKPDFALAQFNLSKAYRFSERRNDALSPARKAVKLTPQNVEIRSNLCELSLELELNQEAADCYETLANYAQPDVRIQTSYGLALLRTKNLKKAQTILTETVQLFPNHASVHNVLGVTLINRKKYKEAIQSIEQALEIDPNFEVARFNLAVAQVRSKNRSSAIENYRILQNSNSRLAAKLYRIIFSDKVLFVGNRAR